LSADSRAPVRSDAPLLECHGLAAGYGAVHVVDDVSLKVFAGEVVALLGANGAGKTTTLLTLSGELPALAGEVWFSGRKVKVSLHWRARHGLGYVTEERSVFMGLTTAQNLRVGRCNQDDALDLFPELRERLNVKAGLLSGGEQQMLALARALARGPKILLADELSLGLAPLVVDRLLRAVRLAADRGAGVLLVEQHVSKALAVADRGYVMRRGQLIMEGAARDLSTRVREIERSYLAGSEEDTDGQ